MVLGGAGAGAAGTRKALERVPDGRFDWKPHEKSMSLGRLARLVASMPAWLVMMVTRDELDFNPPGGSTPKSPEPRTRAELVAALDHNVAQARRVLTDTTDEHLQTSWKLLAGGHLISEEPRYVAIRHGVFNHLAHHRGQLTVYLRLLDAVVPAIYGPSADEAD